MVRLHAVSTTPPDEERDREIAFQNWLASAETEHLECRVGRHIFPGLSDKTTNLSVVQGVCYVEATCIRCTAVQHKTIGVKNGYLTGTGRMGGYAYPEGYLLPKDATGPGGTSMDKAHRAMVRLEVVDRAFQARGSSLAAEIRKDHRKQQAAERKAQPVVFQAPDIENPLA